MRTVLHLKLNDRAKELLVDKSRMKIHVRPESRTVRRYSAAHRTSSGSFAIRVR